MKKIFALILITLLLSGCSTVNINKQSYDEIVDSILVKETKLKTVSLEGYSYYLPQGVNLSGNKKFNSVLYYNHKKMYLYVDLISYYHKVDSNYEVNSSSYYSLPINKDGKKGYLEITKLEDNYYIEFMYNYSKIEAYVDYDDIKKTITVMTYILNSIKVNDSVLESMIGSNLLNYSEEEFNIFKPNGATNNYLDILDQYDDGRLDAKDEDILDLDENMNVE